jgi:hypothetical protein
MTEQSYENNLRNSKPNFYRKQISQQSERNLLG